LTERILVTGGAGYVGSHACRALRAAGYEPVCYDSLERGHREAVQWGPLEQGDILDRDRLEQVIARHRPAAAMHFAALACVGESVQQPERYYRTNVTGSLALFKALLDAGVNRLVFSSSCAVYGTPDIVPIPESAARRPINPYGQSKLMVETMLDDLSAARGLRAVALRYFNAAGAAPDGTIGEDHDPETHLIPIALQVAAGARPHLEIFGDDYDTPDGTCLRDYVHVCDIADAHVRALAYLERGGATTAFNVGNARGQSVREIAFLAAAVSGAPIPTRRAPRRTGDPPRLIADATRARNELGWLPAMSDPETILQSAWNWHRGRSGRG
jgi:UDP-arabinose 4-epimerase